MRRDSTNTRRAPSETAPSDESLPLAVAFFVVCVGLSAITGCTEGDAVATAPSGPKPAYVELATIEPELLRHEVALTGQFGAESSVMIRPEIDGVIESIAFDEGRSVDKGDLLIVLRNGEQKARLALAQAELKLAQDVFGRTQQLNSRDISAVAQVAEATAKLDEGQARVDLARVALDRTYIRAPFDGVVGAKRVHPGERVEEGEPLVTLDAVERLQLTFTVQSTGFMIGKVGDVIHARVYTYPDDRFPGEVFFISPTVDPATRRLILKAWVSNEDGRLKPGMFANVDVEVAQREGALVVPESALVYDRHGTYLWRVTADDEAEKVPVRIGLRQKGRVEIVEGLAAGDRVISAGTHKVLAGTPVIDVDAEAATHAGPSSESSHPDVATGEEG